jgi:hypothetical protein
VWVTAAAFALVVAMGAASPAAAQDGPGLFVGYQFINSSVSGASTSVPAGWVAGVSFPIASPLSIVAVVDGGYKSDQVFSGDSSKTHSVLGGIEYSLNAINMMTPTVHVAAGVAHGSYDPGSTGTAAGALSQSSNDGVIDFGGGIGYALTDRLSAFVNVGYRRVMATNAANQFRLSVGVGFPIGG